MLFGDHTTDPNGPSQCHIQCHIHYVLSFKYNVFYFSQLDH